MLHGTNDKLAYSVTEAASIIGIGRDKLYDAIRANQLRAKRDGGRTLILRGDLEAYLRALPDLDLSAAG